MARAVRSEGKRVKGCIAMLLKWSWENSYSVDKDIIHLSGIKGPERCQDGYSRNGNSIQAYR